MREKKINLRHKKAIGLLLIFLICPIFSYYKIELVFSKLPLNDKDFTSQNIGAPNFKYNDFIIHDSYAYCFDYQNVSIYDIKDIRKISLINQLDFSGEQFFNTFIGNSRENFLLELEENKYVNFNLYSNSLIINTLQINGTATPIYHSVSVINLTNQISSYSFVENNILYFIAIEKGYIESVHSDEELEYYNSTLYTIDISNISSPVIKSIMPIHYELDFTIWNNPSRYIFSYDSYSIYDNHLYCLRAFRTYNFTDSFLSSKCEFAYGFIKILDISNLSSPVEVIKFELTDWDYSKIKIQNGLLFYSYYKGGFDIYNISNPANFYRIIHYNSKYTPVDYFFNENICYLILEEGIEILDTTDLLAIKKLGGYKITRQGNGDIFRGILKNNSLFLLRTSEYSDRCFFVIDSNDLSRPIKTFPDGFRVSQQFLFNFTTFFIISAIVIIPIIFVVLFILMIRRKRGGRYK